jgi:acyl transferase domain-containing protein
MFIGLARGHFLTSSGQCKSFDASADGYSRGEGCGVFVLKRLSDAMAENDRILGIIRGVEVNQSGNAPSITHPHGPAQKALFKRVLSGANVKPNSVTVVEAHGTGTQAGDTNEIESIRRVLAIDRMPNNPLYVTSIKANIGHLEAASGCASLAKILLMFQYNRIPQQISLKVLNPRIAPLASDNTIISTENVPWKPENDRTPRIALVNNFGAAGSNVALLVEEHLSQKATIPSSGTSSYLFGLSTKDASSLEALRLKYIAWLESGGTDGISLSDIAYSMTARRQLHCCRLAVTAGSRSELAKKLVAAPIVNVTGTGVTPVVFLFSGQGSQYRGMGRSLYDYSRVFRCHIQECDTILASLGFPGITPIIVGNDDCASPNIDAEQLQTATFAVQYALAKLWISSGIQPMVVMGHRSVSRSFSLAFTNAV